MDVPSKRIHTFELCVGGLLSVVSVAIASLSDAKVSFTVSLATPNITFREFLSSLVLSCFDPTTR